MCVESIKGFRVYLWASPGKQYKVKVEVVPVPGRERELHQAVKNQE